MKKKLAVIILIAAIAIGAFLLFVTMMKHPL